jgi:hypothetical protein
VAVAASAVAVAAPAASASTTPRQQAVVSHAAQQGKWASHIAGSFGKYGKVTGHFKPARSYVRNGQTVVQGDLTATLRRSNGQLVGHVVRRDLVLPVKASGAHTARTSAAAPAAAQASCTILHLVLGPLDLNLLGLQVHLNQVVLDITAQSGSGNLLGNLLCAVAHLLDNTSPSLSDLLNLSSLLNRIIGILT